MTVGAWVVVAAVVLACGVGCLRAATDGRFRGRRRASSLPADEARATDQPAEGTAWAQVRAALPDAEAGGRATLLQFSSAFCAPCRATRRVLSDVAAGIPGVVHVEVDAERHLELVRALRVTRTPTTVVLDAAGLEVSRAAGAPRKEQVLNAIAQAT